MGQITIFIKENDPDCQAVRLDLKHCRLPFQEIVLDASEPHEVPEIFFDNHPVQGGIPGLLSILEKWEVVQGNDGRPTLQPISSNSNSGRLTDTATNSSPWAGREGNDEGYSRNRDYQHHHPQDDRKNTMDHSYALDRETHRQLQRHTEPYRQYTHTSYVSGNREAYRDEASGRGRERQRQESSYKQQQNHEDCNQERYRQLWRQQQQEDSSGNDFHRRVHYRDNRRLQRQAHYLDSLEQQDSHSLMKDTSDRRNTFRDSYQRHSFDARELRRQAQREEMMMMHSKRPQQERPQHQQHTYQREASPKKSLSPKRSGTSEYGYQSMTSPTPERRDHSNSRVSPTKLHDNSNPADARMKAYQTGSQDRHSFHGNEVRRQNRYQDDDRPFDRRSSAGHGQEPSASAPTVTKPMVTKPPPPPMATMDDASGRRKQFHERKTYERHSFDARTLRQQYELEQRQQQQYHQNAAGHGSASSFGSHKKHHESNNSKHSGSLHKTSSSRKPIHEIHLKSGNAHGYYNPSDNDEKTFADDDDSAYSECSSILNDIAEFHDSETNMQDSDSRHNLNASQGSFSAHNLLMEADESDRTPTVEAMEQSRLHGLKNKKTPPSMLNNSRSSLQSSTHGGGSLGNLNSSHASLAPEDLMEQSSEHDESKTVGTTPMMKYGGSSCSALSRSNSKKSLHARLNGVRKAASLRYLGSKGPDAESNDSAAVVPDKEITQRLNQPDQKIGGKPSRRSVSPIPTKRSNSKGRPPGLLHAARSLSSRSLKNIMGVRGREDSSSSLMSAVQTMNEDATKVELPLGTSVTVLEATVELQRIVPRDSLKHNLTTYSNAFTGSTFADALQEAYGLSREEAVALGKSLYRARLVRHVCNDHTFDDTSKRYYRLHCHQTPEVLNSFCIWRDEASLTKHGEEVVRGVMEKMQPLLSTITNSEKGRIHYSRATKHHPDLMAQLDFAVCEFQAVKLQRMDKKSLLAFGLNVYQIFLHYAFVKVGIPASDENQATFWTSLKFNVGGDLYTLADWWNGICRGNRKGPHGPKPFNSKDSRMFLSLPDPVDPRIHFAAAMTHFIRPMMVYSAAKIDSELEHVARMHCKNADFVTMDAATNTLFLAPYFKTYAPDFAPTTNDLPKAFTPFMPRKDKARMNDTKTIKVEFLDSAQLDGWAEVAGEHFVFDSAPKGDFKALVKKKSEEPRREVKRSGSLKAVLRFEGTVVS